MTCRYWNMDPQFDNDEVFPEGTVEQQNYLFRCLEHHKNSLSAMISSITHGDHAAVNDVLQITARKALTKLSTFNGESKLGTWLYQIAKNTAINYQNRQRFCTDYFLESDIPDENTHLPGHKIKMQEIGGIVNQAIHELSPTYRQVIQKRLVEEKTYAQIAAETHLKLNTVKSRMKRGKEQLVSLLKDYDL